MPMWDDATIGKYDGPQICSAIRIFDIEGMNNVSHNHVSFWITDVYLDMGMRIYKDTPEGKTLTAMIIEKASNDVIQEFLKDVLLTHVPRENLLNAIDNAIEEAYYKGRESKKQEIINALNSR